MLIIEEQLIVSVDLQRQLQKKGYKVVIGKTIRDIVMAIEKKLPDIIIVTPMVLIQNIPEKESDLLQSIYSIWSEIPDSSDTVILVKNTSGCIHFPKPYKTADIVNYINKCFPKPGSIKTR